MILYFLLVFLFTWALWFAADAISATPIRWVVFTVGVFMPGIVALGMTYRRRGSSGVRSLLGRLVKWDVGGRWLAFAFLYMATVKVLVALIARVSTGAWPVFGDEPVPLMFAAAVSSTLLGGQVGEELGWRGYALPRMAGPLGLGPASLLLGAIWAAWHLPLFYVFGGDKIGQSFTFYLLQVTAMSVASAWLYMKTGGSLLATMLLHAAANNTKDIVPSALATVGNPWQFRASLAGGLTLAILWLFAIVFLYDMRRDRTVAGLAESP